MSAMREHSFLRDAEDTFREALTEFDGAIRHGRVEPAPAAPVDVVVEQPSPARDGGWWDSIFRLKPLVLAVVFVLVIAGELADDMDGLSAGAVAVMWTSLAALAWELVARAVRARRASHARTGS
jgi:hypothetical protein